VYKRISLTCSTLLRWRLEDEDPSVFVRGLEEAYRLIFHVQCYSYLPDPNVQGLGLSQLNNVLDAAGEYREQLVDRFRRASRMAIVLSVDPCYDRVTVRIDFFLQDEQLGKSLVVSLDGRTGMFQGASLGVP